MSDPERVRRALDCLSPNCPREEWLYIGMGVHDELGEAGWPIFDEWSSGGDSYKHATARNVWKSFKQGGGKGFGYVVDLAKREGFDAKVKGFVKPTPEQVAEREAKHAARQKVHAAEEAEEARIAAEWANRAWEKATVATAHPYADQKRISLEDLRTGDFPVWRDGDQEPTWLSDVLLIPMRDEKGTLRSLQGIINPKTKLNLKNGAKKGHFFPVGRCETSPDGFAQYKPLVDADGVATFAFGEGVATAKTAHAATGHLVFSCFDAANMVEVARRLHAVLTAKKRKFRFLFLGDNDLGTPGNPGLLKATLIAYELKALLAYPPARVSDPDRNIDFNDVMVEAAEGGLTDQDALAIVATLIDSAAVPVGPYKPPQPPTVLQRDAEAAGEPDAVPATLVPHLEEYPCWRVFDEPVFHEGKGYHGLFYFGMKDGGKSADAKPKPFHIYVSGPLHIVAQTHAASEKHSYGRLLRWKTSTGKWQEWAMPAEMLAGDAKEARAALLGQGLEISPDAHQYLKRWLARGADRLDSVHCVQQTGWTSDAHDAFVLPSRAIGPKAAKAVLQVEQPEVDPYEQHGTLDGWRHTVAGMAPGNSALTVGIAIAFAGPLLDVVGAEPGGLHIWGDSSTGKSTVLAAACSAWGYHKRFGKSWRTTANGLEGAAAHRTDTLLALDEIGQCEPAHLGDSIYLIGNGTGKQRANITGAARAVKNFRVVVLSTGEMSVSAALEKGGVKMRAGQGVRLIDLCGVGRAHGMWDDLHHYASGAAFSDGVKSAAGEHFGHAGPVFIERLARADHGALRARYTELKTKLAGYARGEQAGRVAHRLAAYAMAGELATEFGLTGWAPGWATDAMVAEFKLWQDGRSTKGQGNAEPHQIMQAIVDFIQKHGDSRFESASGSASERVVLNRAGWWRKAPGEDVQHLFTASALKEATIGFDLDRVLAVLDDVGAIAKQESRVAKGKRGILVKINGKPEFVYAVTSAVLQGKLHPEMA